MDKPREACPVCERLILVTVTGHLRTHDAPRRRQGPLSRCAGSGEFIRIPPSKPVEDQTYRPMGVVRDF